ncbi:hypothetical protein [Tenacibaculum maritimum]|uniref:hypothetical protein n=1 Tax=Tenacibaculum sp. C7A-26P2 TaxID=3447504 RepID=UPI00230792DC|nr:hypothetical protein [Tenacibaculum maritimum]MDB0613831.1 hypothetical protein [Tenacibaculum maritimum]
MYTINNNFTLSYMTCDLLDVQAGDGIMFSFNYKTRKAFVVKDNEIDSFKLNRMSTCKLLRFSSVDLVDHFLNCFGLDQVGVHVFQLTKKGKKFELEYVV